MEFAMTKNLVSNYGWTTSEGEGSSSYITPEIIAILTKLGVKRVVDIGSGNGHLCSKLAEKGFQVVGAEYDEQGVEIARKSYPSIPFYRVDVQEDPQLLLSREDKFDAAVSTEVIEHLFSPHALPIYASKVLKEGGYLVLTTPYHGYLKNLALSLFNKWDFHHTALWHGGHIKFWSRATLTQLLEQNGFEVVSFSGVGRVPYVWKSMVIVARRS
jgi:2-polyprenyl-3-methyl-5-hydroxy-6-metoxy-1,4-benzoquinol methylase